MSAGVPVRLRSFDDKPRYARFHLEGYLDKRASKGVGVRWQTRYFRTVNNLLVYTDTKESAPAQVHKIFDVTAMNELAHDPQDSTKCQLLVGFKGISGLLHLRAATPEGCQKWISALSGRQGFLEEETQALHDIKKSTSGQAGKPQSIELATAGLRFAIGNLTTSRELAVAMSIAARAGIGLKSALYSEAEARLVELGGGTEAVAAAAAAAAAAAGKVDSAGAGSAAGGGKARAVEQSAEDQFFNVLDNEPVEDTDFERFLKEAGVGDYVGIASLLESNNYVDPPTLSVLEDWQLELLGVPVEDIAAIVSSEALKECREEAARAERADEAGAARAAAEAAAAEECNGGAAPSGTEVAAGGAKATPASAVVGGGESSASAPSGASTTSSGFAKDLHARTGRATVWRCLQAGAHVRDRPQGKETRKMEMGELITQSTSEFGDDNRLWIGFCDKLDAAAGAGGGAGTGAGSSGACAPLRWTVTTDRKVQTKLKLEPLIESKHSALVSKGADVEVKYGAGQGNWTKATVLAINADDTLKVRYRDGEIEKGVRQMHVRVSVETGGSGDSGLLASDARLLHGSAAASGSSTSTRAVPEKDRLVKGMDYHQKLTAVLLGNSNVGKSSMMQRYVTSQFQSHQMNTIGIDHREVLVEAALRSTGNPEDKEITLLSIWDTAGQERFANLSRNYVRRMDCILLCFDITNVESFQAITSWTTFLQESVDTDAKVVFLVGTKTDLADERVVTRSEAEALTTRLQPLLGDVPYFECSAKTGHSINTIFEALVPFWRQKHGDRLQAEQEQLAKQSTSLANLAGGNGDVQNKRKSCC